ncbi:MAG: DNA repair protein RadA [Ignavibacteriaceae bacterium]|nr:DNA repair protein RadA [Ignavibacteriaceae bacterium]
MAKQKIKYVCSNCSFESPKWLGKCPECDMWNTLTEELVETGPKRQPTFNHPFKAVKLNDITADEEDRIKTGINEFDRVLGGGLMPGSVVLLGGDPGIGKSTLAMQSASRMKETVLYVTGEESLKQIKLRAARLKISSENFHVMAETELGTIISGIHSLSPAVVIIDSIQTMYRSELANSPGTVTQIRECTSLLMEEAKRNLFSVIIVGHVTKEGIIAGPKILEHIVDTVIQFEGETKHSFRILRAQKNRFGSTNEIGVFEMHEDGLTEVKNPSELFLSERGAQSTGSVVTASIEGTRPILLEVQALVTPSNYGNPQRVTTGFDYRRLSILLAVLEKRANARLSATNVFLNMAGGVKIDEPAVDLAVCSAIASSLFDKPADKNSVIIGEVGLGGEVRSVGHIEKRIQEAEKLGFTRIIIPQNNLKGMKATPGIEVRGVSLVTEAMRLILTTS